MGVALENPLALAPTEDRERPSSLCKQAWTAVPSKKKKLCSPVVRSEKDLLHPLPQRAGPRHKPVQIHAGGYECTRNPASGPRWAEPRVANLSEGSVEEDLDSSLNCYIWDRSVARPKADHCQPAQQCRQHFPR